MGEQISGFEVVGVKPEPNTASSESPTSVQASKANGEQRREGAFTGSATQPPVDGNSPLPGEDEHRPFDLTTMRQVRVVDPSKCVIIKGDNGRLEFLSDDMVSGRLATVESKAVYKVAPNGNLVEGYETDKGLIVTDVRGNRLVSKQQQENYRKV